MKVDLSHRRAEVIVVVGYGDISVRPRYGQLNSCIVLSFEEDMRGPYQRFDFFQLLAD